MRKGLSPVCPRPGSHFLVWTITPPREAMQVQDVGSSQALPPEGAFSYDAPLQAAIAGAAPTRTKRTGSLSPRNIALSSVSIRPWSASASVWWLYWAVGRGRLGNPHFQSEQFVYLLVLRGEKDHR
jgi:hypothetical protein